MILSGIFFVLLLFVPAFVSCIENCSVYLNQYRSLEATASSTLLTETTGKYCGHLEQTCCTTEVEENLKELSKSDYDQALKKVLTNLSRMFKSKYAKFNEFFKELLTKSKKDFHEMFKKTYGMVYEQNSYVFSDFFNELEKYFSHGKSNLADVMDTFFNILYQKMFTVMNSQYKFDDKYLGCVSEHMNELKPFGDVPSKLSLPLKRSFVAARVYSQSLNIVGEIVANVINLVPSENCYNAVTKMSQCSLCKGVPNAKACYGLCLNVMKGCLALHSELDTEWNAFVDALHKVQGRLLGPFNLELVVEPINVKISEAIMNFQESANHISAKVFNGCGKPPLLDGTRRKRREAKSYQPTEQRNNMQVESNEESSNTERGRRKNKQQQHRGNASPNRSPNNKNDKGRRKTGEKSDVSEEDTSPFSSSPIDGFLKFIQEIGEQYVLPTKYLWKRLPYNICSDEMYIEKNGTTVCWNGHTMGNYDVREVLDGLKNQQYNNEVPVDPKRQSTTINEQLYTLKSVTLQLKNAFNGQDVEWIDNEETFDSSSGSGMYSPDEDNFEIIHSAEGSGDLSYTNKYDTKTFDSSTVSVRTGLENILNRTDNAGTTTVSTTTTYLVDISSTFAGVIESTTIGGTHFNVSRNGTTSDGSRIRNDKMSLNQAIATYLLPTVVMWIGGSFNEWFHTFTCHFLL